MVYKRRTRRSVAPEVFERRWREASILARELGQLAPILLEGKPVGPEPVQIVDGIYSRFVSYGGKLYIIAANSMQKEAEFSLWPGSIPGVELTPETVLGKWTGEGDLVGGDTAAAGIRPDPAGVLRDTLPPYGVAVYVLR